SPAGPRSCTAARSLPTTASRASPAAPVRARPRARTSRWSTRVWTSSWRWAGAAFPVPLRRGLRLLDLGGQGRHERERIGDDAVIGHLEDVGVGILVDRDDRLALGHAGEMLDRAGDPDRDVQIRRDGLAGLADLLLVRAPSGVGHGAGRAERGTEGGGELLDELPVLGPAKPAPAGHDDARLRERHA